MIVKMFMRRTSVLWQVNPDWENANKSLSRLLNKLPIWGIFLKKNLEINFPIDLLVLVRTFKMKVVAVVIFVAILVTTGKH